MAIRQRTDITIAVEPNNLESLDSFLRRVSVCSRSLSFAMLDTTRPSPPTRAQNGCDRSVTTKPTPRIVNPKLVTGVIFAKILLSMSRHSLYERSRMKFQHKDEGVGRSNCPFWSGQRDLNPRPLTPQISALPNCAMPRCCRHPGRAFRIPLLARIHEPRHPALGVEVLPSRLWCRIGQAIEPFWIELCGCFCSGFRIIAPA